MDHYDRLTQIVEEIDDLIAAGVDSSSPAFIAWYTDTLSFLYECFGETSVEAKAFKKTSFYEVHMEGVYTDKHFREEHVKECKQGLLLCKLTFKKYLNRLKPTSSNGLSSASKSGEKDTAKVFIVHGHNGELKQSVARLVEKQGLDAIILSEQVNKGNTIIEKFEENSNVGGAICLFTADDLGRAKDDKNEQTRARQNVVLETGYFMGKLGRDHVVILADPGIEMPSDLSGVVYTNTTNWQVDLFRELKAMGYEVDFNKLF